MGSSEAARPWAVVVDVSDLDRGVAFWGGLLGLTEQTRRDPYSYLGEIAQGLQLVLQQTRDPKPAKNRVHLELTSEDPEATVRWVIDHGGRELARPHSPDYELVVVADPDGNELCVSTRRSRESDTGLP